MFHDWQSLAAPGIVLLTLGALAVHAWKRARNGKSSCGSESGCPRIGKAYRSPGSPPPKGLRNRRVDDSLNP